MQRSEMDWTIVPPLVLEQMAGQPGRMGHLASAEIQRRLDDPQRRATEALTEGLELARQAQERLAAAAVIAGDEGAQQAVAAQALVVDQVQELITAPAVAEAPPVT